MTTLPTCEDKGVKTFSCGCGESYTEEVPALGHAYDDGTVTTQPTCEDKGVKTYTCTNGCGGYTEEVDALGHAYDDGEVTTQPTCTEKGVKTYNCANGCDGYTEDIPALGHKWNQDKCDRCLIPYFSEGLKYSLNADKSSYSVAGLGTCMDTDIVIPSTYNNLPVTSIGEEAFRDCDSLTSVEIPDSVTSISHYAFDGTAYYNNESNWENGVLYIGKYLIKAQGTISGAYTIKEGTLCIADSAFYHCDSLTSVEIPDSVTSIGAAFGDCYSLTSVVIPDSVTSIGNFAFYNCTSLESVVIGDSVTSIGDWAFYNCDSLTSVEIGDSVTSIGGHAFHACYSLTGVEIPDSLTSIGSYAFCGCKLLISVEIPDSVTSIGDRAFDDCDSLTSVVIGDPVTSIGDMAFYPCPRLTSVYYVGTAEEWSNITIGSSNSNLTNATRYYYSESSPTEDGNWWHYVNGQPTSW